MTKLTRCINWNDVEDPLDSLTWDVLVGQFWIPEAVPIAQDLPSWRMLDDSERELIGKVLTTLGCLDHLQGTVGAVSLIPDSQTPHEEAVYTNIAFMESVHARSYSTCFQTLFLTPDIDRLFSWAETNKRVDQKLSIIENFYRGDDPYKKKIASTMLESFLFYSSFFYPLYLASRGKLTNVANIIKLIMRDESVHGQYIGAKFQKQIAHLPSETQEELKDFTIGLLLDLYENEERFTEELYDEVGLTAEVKTFLRYNANRALQNLGYDAVFPSDMTQVSPEILSAISGKESNHDFFSQKGSSYKVIGTSDIDDSDDWDF